MKVIVQLAIEVDREAWDRAYGSGTKAADIRREVRDYVQGLAAESAAAHEGGITEVTHR